MVETPRLMTVVLDETLDVQTVRVPLGAKPIAVDYNPDQPRLTIFADPEAERREAFRVWFIRNEAVVGRLRSIWFRGAFRTNSGVRITCLVEPLDATAIDSFGPMVWAGAWTVERDYTLEEIVRAPAGLYRCKAPVGANPSNPEPGVDSGWEDQWEPLTSSASRWTEHSFALGDWATSGGREELTLSDVVAVGRVYDASGSEVILKVARVDSTTRTLSVPGGREFAGIVEIAPS